MTGVDDLFREFSQPDEFHLQAQLELFAWLAMRAQRERQKRWRQDVKCDPARRERRRAYQRTWLRDYFKRKRATDPAWTARVKEQNRLANVRYRAKRRAA